MELLSKGQLACINTLISKLGLESQKNTLCASFSQGRTESRSGLFKSEAAELIGYLKRKDPEEAAAERMRRKILAMCHEMRWYIPGTDRLDMQAIDEWMRKYSYLKKGLNQYLYKELPKLVTQFEAKQVNQMKNLILAFLLLFTGTASAQLPLPSWLPIDSTFDKAEAFNTIVTNAIPDYRFAYTRSEDIGRDQQFVFKNGSGDSLVIAYSLQPQKEQTNIIHDIWIAGNEESMNLLYNAVFSDGKPQQFKTGTDIRNYFFLQKNVATSYLILAEEKTGRLAPVYSGRWEMLIRSRKRT